MWVELLKTIGLIVGAGALLIVLPLFLISYLSVSRVRKQASTRLEAAQPQMSSYHSDALAAEYRGVKLLCCTREGDVDGLTQIVDTSIYDEKNIIGLTLISPRNIDTKEDKEEIKAMTLRELPEEIREMVSGEMLDQMIEEVLHSERYCIIDNADVICTKDGKWLVKVNGQFGFNGGF